VAHWANVGVTPNILNLQLNFETFKMIKFLFNVIKEGGELVYETIL